jgi:transcriptional regulator with XRE-family HTH domain
MFFGNEHLGKAVVFHREGQGLSQQELAEKLGIKPSTLNQYESGRRGMSEEQVERIAEELNLNQIQIWDTAYRMARYNYFLEWANEEGITVEELIDRVEIRPSIERILASHDSRAAQDRQYTELILRFQESLAKTGLEGHNLLKVVVKPRPRKKPQNKAVRFNEDRKAKPPKS